MTDKLYRCSGAPGCANEGCLYFNPHDCKEQGCSGSACKVVNGPARCVPVEQESKPQMICPDAGQYGLCKWCGGGHNEPHEYSDKCLFTTNECPVCVPVEPEPELWICPKAETCDWHSKGKHCTPHKFMPGVYKCERGDDDCPACVPYEQSEPAPTDTNYIEWTDNHCLAAVRRIASKDNEKVSPLVILAMCDEIERLRLKLLNDECFLAFWKIADVVFTDEMWERKHGFDVIVEKVRNLEKRNAEYRRLNCDRLNERDELRRQRNQLRRERDCFMDERDEMRKVMRDFSDERIALIEERDAADHAGRVMEKLRNRVIEQRDEAEAERDNARDELRESAKLADVEIERLRRRHNGVHDTNIIILAINEGLINERDELLACCQIALDAFENNKAIDWGILKRVISKAKGTKS